MGKTISSQENTFLGGGINQMETFEKCRIIRAFILRRASEVLVYENWSEGFAVDWLRGCVQVCKEDKKTNFFDINPSDLTLEQVLLLGFLKFGENQYLVPLWLYPFLNDELTLTCIDGTPVTKKTEIDTDNRSGMLGYYVKVKE